MFGRTGNAMPFQAVPNVAQIVLEGIVDGQLTVNDLYFEISGGGITSVNLAELVDAMNNWFTGVLAAPLSPNWTAQRTIGIDLTSVTGPRREASTPTIGGGDGEAAPNNVAACVSLRTENRGRSFHGRNFVPGIPNSEITLNTLSPTIISALTTAYFGLVGPGTFLPGWQLVVVSRITGGAVRAVGIATPVVDTIMTTNKVKSMRSREVGHGA